MIKNGIWLFSLLVFFPLKAQEFLYPVASINTDEGLRIYLIYQKSVEHLELLLWDPVTHITTPGMLPTFTPGDLQLIPGGGISFNDKGRIRVKSLNKRSPKSIVFDEPLDEVGSINWIDDKTFYFMAKTFNQHALFQSNLQGTVYPLVNEQGIDSLYPQKFGGSLFYIQRTQDKKYTIQSIQYPVIDDQKENDRSSSLADLSTKKLLFDFGSQAVSFLYMTSGEKGYYLEHPTTISLDEKIVPFTYCAITKIDDGTWERKALFSFQLPAHYFISSGEFRLYESLLPLLPRHIQGDDRIFFTHCDDLNTLKTKVYNYNTSNNPWAFNYWPFSRKEIKGSLFSSTVSMRCYSPKQKQEYEMVFYGGEVEWLDDNKFSGFTSGAIKYGLLSFEFPREASPLLWLNNEGLLCAYIPYGARPIPWPI
jgi:hypothetical protein